MIGNQILHYKIIATIVVPFGKIPVECGIPSKHDLTDMKGKYL
jgi:hypothetical protein